MAWAVCYLCFPSVRHVRVCVVEHACSLQGVLSPLHPLCINSAITLSWLSSNNLSVLLFSNAQHAAANALPGEHLRQLHQGRNYLSQLLLLIAHCAAAAAAAFPGEEHLH